MRPTSLAFSARGAATATLTLSNAGGEPFDFRVLSSSPAFAVTPFEGRVSGVPATLTVALDRSALGGLDSAYLMVNTTAGSRRVPVSVALSLDGRWTAAFNVESPVALGEHLAALNLSTADGGTLSGMVVGDDSPVWGGVNAKVRGSVSTTATSEVLAFSFRMVAPQGTSPNPAVPATLERLVSVTGERTEAGTIKGTFVETIRGLVGTGLEIRGTVAMHRLGPATEGAPVEDSSATVGPVADPFVNASGSPLTDYVVCHTCPTSQCTTEPVSNGNSFLNFTKSGTEKASMSFYDEFLPASTAPFAGADKCVDPVGNDVTACSSRRVYDPFYIRCAQYWYAKAIREDNPLAIGPFLDSLEIPADAALYNGNAAIAAAFDDWYDPNASLYKQEAYLASASTALLAGLYSTPSTPIGFGDPGLVTYLAAFPASSTANNYATTTKDTSVRGYGEQLRRGAQVVTAFLLATEQRGYILRKQGKPKDAARILASGVVAGYLAIESLGPALSKSTVWDSDIASTKTHWHQLLTALTELADGRNALGYASGYVPFLWNKDAQGTTNYQQIKTAADNALTQWRATHDAAQSGLRTFESSGAALSTELTYQFDTLRLQLQELCGAGATDAESCGSDFSGAKASQMAQAKLDLMGAVNRVEQVATQISTVFEEIRIEEARAAKVAGVHKNNAMLIRQNGQKVSVIEQKIGRVHKEQQFNNDILNGVQAAIGGSFWGAAGNVVIGVAHAVINSDAAEATLELEADRAVLQTDERSRLEFSYATVELINSAAVVAQKNLQLNSLFIEADLARINLAQSAGRMNAVYARAQSVLATTARASVLNVNKGSQAIHARLFANHAATLAAGDQRTAVQWAFLATRALEYQLNASLDQSLLWESRSPLELSSYLNKLADAAAMAGSAQTRTDVVSLRDQILGLNTPIKDVVTGAVVSPRERFRQYVMSPKNRDENGSFHIRFLTNDEANPIFSAILGSDRIRSVKMNLIGDNLGAGVTVAEVQLIHGGTSYLRAIHRDGSGRAPLTAYDVSGKGNQPRLAVVQAGVNTPRSSLPDNTELQERAILAGPWQLIIDPATPANANLNLAGLDDIELIFTHDAYTIQ